MKRLAHRAKTVVSEREDRRKEFDKVRGALKCTGYPEWFLRELKEENNSELEEGNIRGNNGNINEREIKENSCPDPIRERILGTNEMSFQKIWHSNTF